MRVCVAPSADQFALALAEHVATLSRESIHRHGRFDVAISGGILAKALQLLPNHSIDYDKWHMYYADERLVPLDHADSNHGLVVRVLGALGIGRFVPIEYTENAETVAHAYAACLKAALDLDQAPGLLPVFDCILLGMGPDGHTCSLFPDHPSYLTESQDCVIPVYDSPKPPPTRVSLSMAAVNKARSIVWVVTGEGKKDVVKRVIQGHDLSLPSAKVRRETAVWFLDTPAASGLSSYERLA